MSVRKRNMLIIDRLEPLAASMYRSAILFADMTPIGYGGIYIEDDSQGHIPFNLGRLPLGEESPTYVYLVAFSDWHGERFIKVGIGLAQRVRNHELQGGKVLQKVLLPRWQAALIERAILREYPKYRPQISLPQQGDTECLDWDAAAQIKLARYVKLWSEVPP